MIGIFSTIEAIETPEEFSNKVMDLLKEHTENKNRESQNDSESAKPFAIMTLKFVMEKMIVTKMSSLRILLTTVLH